MNTGEDIGDSLELCNIYICFIQTRNIYNCLFILWDGIC